MNIYVGNLPFSATEAEVRKLFEAFGSVDSVSLQEKGGKRIARVEMENDQQAAAAIKKLDGSKKGGNTLEVRAG